MEKNLAYYVQCFSNLRRNNERGGAPHKPVLLLSVIDLYASGLLNGCEIPITPELIAVFNSNWNIYAKQSEHVRNFIYPYFHMRSECFWNLNVINGRQERVARMNSIGSFKELKENVTGAYIDSELAAFLGKKEEREILKNCLRSVYFNSIEVQGLSIDDAFIATLKEPDVWEREEEVYVRGEAFKREIPRIYNYTCAISGLRVSFVDASVSMVDACHIVPYSESHNDKIENGIALSPNLHRAFDRGLISISDDYTVLVNKRLVEDSRSVYNFKQFEGQKIILPFNEDLYPSTENLAIHRKKFGF